MDMLAMSFPPRSFTLVLDKCTFDALTTIEGSPWHPNASTRHSTHLLLSSISILLPPRGRYIMVSFTQPHFRLRYLTRASYQWHVSWQRIGHGITAVYIYTCTRGEEGEERYDELGWSDDEGNEGGEAAELSSDDEDVLGRIDLGEGD